MFKLRLSKILIALGILVILWILVLPMLRQVFMNFGLKEWVTSVILIGVILFFLPKYSIPLGGFVELLIVLAIIEKSNGHSRGMGIFGAIIYMQIMAGLGLVLFVFVLLGRHFSKANLFTQILGLVSVFLALGTFYFKPLIVIASVIFYVAFMLNRNEKKDLKAATKIVGPQENWKTFPKSESISVTQVSQDSIFVEKIPCPKCNFMNSPGSLWCGNCDESLKNKSN